MNNTRTPAFFIANLGSEVSRLQSALSKGDTERVAGSLERTRVIFRELFELPLREAARSEIKILKEVIEDLPGEKPRFSIDAKSLQSYFLPFAHVVLDTPYAK